MTNIYSGVSNEIGFLKYIVKVNVLKLRDNDLNAYN